MFTEKFDSYAVVGESISCVLNGTTYTVTLEHDGDTGIDDDDMHCEDQSVTGCDDAQHARAMSARQGWYKDEWFYGYITLSAETADGWSKDHLQSLGGIEINYPDGNNDYLTEAANELLREYIAEQTAKIDATLRELATRQHVNHCTDSMMNAAILGSGT